LVRVADAEIEAMSKIAEALSTLVEEDRGRVVRWAAERFGVGLAGRSHRRPSGEADQADYVDAGDGEETSHGMETQTSSGRPLRVVETYAAVSW
jgi:hypothetical protein